MIIPQVKIKYTRTALNILVLLLCFILTQCANESVPQGGKKDEAPPELKKISPPNKSIHFDANKVEITFNEFIKQGSFIQTLISPPMDKVPDYKVAGKKLTIVFNSPLRANTTYTINFADDIQDVNEGNILNNFTYVFSTGDYIDSQRVSGSVALAKDNSVQEGVIISLYPEDSVDGIVYGKPYYFAKTSKSGDFQIQNIKSGKYRVYALKDQNYNYLYDQPNELIGFSDSLLNLTDSLPKRVAINLFEETRGRITLDMVQPLSAGFMKVIYTKPIRKFRIESEMASDSDFYYFNETNDTISYWYKNFYIDKAKVALIANDTLVDTARIELKFIAKDTMFSNKGYALSIVNQYINAPKDTANRIIYNVQELYKPLKINFTRPVTGINEFKALRVLEDSTGKSFEAKFSVDEKTKMFLVADFEKIENTPYTLEIPDSIFQDVLGTWNQKALYKFQTNRKENYGNIQLTLKAADPSKNYIIRLINAENQLIKELSFSGEGEKKITIENILAGTYKFNVIDDRNKNGRWDTGDFRNKIQPEKIFTIKDAYQLKGGWDLDVEVKF